MGDDAITPRIKRANGYFTTETAVEQRKRQSLCEQCGRQPDCTIWRSVSRITAEGTAIVPIKVCRDFIPFLPFASERGLKLPRYNTFRMGAAFYQRLFPGLRVILLNSTRREAIGIAQVESLHVGTLREMSEKHSAFNHMLIGHPHHSPSERMFEVLRKSYGKLFVDWDRQTTVIYLKWIGDVEEGKALLS
jgi:hypothetical protein